MGTRPSLEPATWAAPFPLLAGDRLLLCSDGLYEKIEPAELASMAGSRSAEQACRALVQLAADRASSDNASAAILEVQS